MTSRQYPDVTGKAQEELYNKQKHLVKVTEFDRVQIFQKFFDSMIVPQPNETIQE